MHHMLVIFQRRFLDKVKQLLVFFVVYVVVDLRQLHLFSSFRVVVTETNSKSENVQNANCAAFAGVAVAVTVTVAALELQVALNFPSLARLALREGDFKRGYQVSRA